MIEQERIRNSSEILNLFVPRTPPRRPLRSRTEERVCGNACVVDGAERTGMAGAILGPAMGLPESAVALSR